MQTLIQSLVPFAILAVFFVLLYGLWNMMRGGSANLSQKIMRWRVGLQFFAVCLIMISFYFSLR